MAGKQSDKYRPAKAEYGCRKGGARAAELELSAQKISAQGQKIQMAEQGQIDRKGKGQNTKNEVWRVKQTRLNLGNQGHAAHQIRIPEWETSVAIKCKFSQGDEIAEIVVQVGRSNRLT